jgi:hypothetical protein
MAERADICEVMLASLFSVVCSHRIDQLAVRDLLDEDERMEASHKYSLLSSITYRAIVTFLMIELYVLCCEYIDATPTVTGFISGFLTGLIAAPFEMQKVHFQMGENMSFKAALYECFGPICVAASVRSGVYDAVFFTLSPNVPPKDTNAVVYATLCAYCLSWPLLYISQQLQTNNGIWLSYNAALFNFLANGCERVTRFLAIHCFLKGANTIKQNFHP